MLTIRGEHTKEHLQRIVDEYVDRFVRCKECGRPDTQLIKEGKTTYLQCEAVLDHKYEVESI